MKLLRLFPTIIIVILFFSSVFSTVQASTYGSGKYGSGLYGIGENGNTSNSNNNSSNDSSNSSSSSAPSCNDQAPGTKAPWLYGAITQDAGSILLYFTEADNPVDNYVLEYGISPGKYQYGAQNMGVNLRGQMTYLVRLLSPNTTYYFRVRAGNGCAVGPWSNEISAKTRTLVAFNQLDIVSSELTFDSFDSNEQESAQPKNAAKHCQTYTVKPKDSLWSIASNLLGNGSKYTEIIEQNKDKYPFLKTSQSLTVGWNLDINCEIAEEIKPVDQTNQGYDVRVKVVDTGKQPVIGAKITIHSKVQEAVTDKDGMVKFSDVEPGEHRILITYQGFEGEQSVNLTGDVKEFSLNITIQPKTILFSTYAIAIIGILIFAIVVLAVILIRTKRRLNKEKLKIVKTLK